LLFVIALSWKIHGMRFLKFVFIIVIIISLIIMELFQKKLAGAAIMLTFALFKEYLN